MRPRNTWQKQAVYEALCALDHPTATEVYDKVRMSYPGVSRGTVFRVLGGFARGGKVRKLQLSDSDVRFDFRTEPHYHARCRNCGAVCDVFLTIPAVPHTLSDGFEIDGYELEFFGLCRDCRLKKDENQS